MFGFPTWALGLVGALSLAIGAFFMGDSAGANRVIARDAKAAARMLAAGAKMQAAFNTQADRLAEAEAARTNTVREIYREVPTIIDRPVYRAVCVDADGVRLIDRATDAANGGGRSGAVADPGDSAPGRPNE